MVRAILRCREGRDEGGRGSWRKRWKKRGLGRKGREIDQVK